MKQDFYEELACARHNLVIAVLACRWNVKLRVAAEDMIILVDQLIAEKPCIARENLLLSDLEKKNSSGT